MIRFGRFGGLLVLFEQGLFKVIESLGGVFDEVFKTFNVTWIKLLIVSFENVELNAVKEIVDDVLGTVQGLAECLKVLFVKFDLLLLEILGMNNTQQNTEGDGTAHQQDFIQLEMIEFFQKDVNAFVVIPVKDK
tara:strand:+ start:121 stop:522 length:402 start_codon:yes stop_codon:yes gene_type:complete